ncbi:MAG: hypothetical protein EBU30_12740, partial [Synechococcaceae bacterium WB6_3B_236]|nr:hypothetical protein [Synechococcaceae bacterium WB6_3B_236]
NVVASGSYTGARPSEAQLLSILSANFVFQAGNLKITADNGAKVYLNGTLLGSTENWNVPYDFNGLTVLPGSNVLAVLAYDVGGIAGLSGRFEAPSGTFGTSNSSGWRVLNVDPEPATDNSAASRDPNRWTLPANWSGLGFDDTSWSTATVYAGPWGNRTGDPTWIWSSDQTNHDAVLFRYKFTGSGSGNLLASGEGSRDLDWSFNSDPYSFDAIPNGQQLVLTYTLRATDSSGAFTDKPITITINGTNDGPVVTNESKELAGSVIEAGSNDDKQELEDYRNAVNDVWNDGDQ